MILGAAVSVDEKATRTRREGSWKKRQGIGGGETYPQKRLLPDPRRTDAKVEDLIERFRAKVRSFPPGTCPLTIQLSFLTASKNQTCGKCVPCRDGLPQLEGMMRSVLDGEATEETIQEMRALAEMIRDTADCAVGYQTATDFLEGMEAYRHELESHVRDHMCPEDRGQKVPCINMCPAHVNVPAYIALIREGDYAGAVRMIRRDNPLPTACAMICEHPCEERCRRNIIDDVINIRGLKKYAVDHAAADKVPVPEAGASTGKRIAVIGGGPAGLTAAYFLGLMGHKVVIYERQRKLGGMLRYGIPNYRFPKDRLDEDLRAVLSAGDIEVRFGQEVGKEIPIDALHREYDAMFVAIGAQTGKRLELDGDDAGRVESAVEMLDRVGNGIMPNYGGQRVAVIGGGNVAMDAARTALRCGARDVVIVYRRRQDDMTALKSEIESAVMEGIELMTLRAPLSIEKDEAGDCAALVVQPQMIGPYKGGRPAPVDASTPPERIPCDAILIAVGQDIVSKPFEEFGLKADRGVLTAGLDTRSPDKAGVFIGGDCATGPATAIRAIAAGRVAAYSIDEYLGYHHALPCDVEVPEAVENDRVPTGRANVAERPAYLRKRDLEHVEIPFTHEEAMQECGRCLRCDHFGCGALFGGVDI
ncbi:MAG: FAD-dependent oxidoreductase [Synergistaceae bacterium]|nr:FAD-dependent oxidoreductase [Synergistaceae bacterium]